MPFNRDEALLDEVLVEDGSISRQNNTAIALLHPVAESADVTRPVHCFQNEGREDAFSVF